MKCYFNELTERLESLRKEIESRDTENYDNYVHIYIPNERHYRMTFQSKCPDDKFKYVKQLGDGNYIFPKQMFAYFKTILTKNNIVYEYLGDFSATNFALNPLTKKLGVVALTGAMLLGGVGCKKKLPPTPISIETVVKKAKTKDIAIKLSEQFKFDNVLVMSKDLGSYKIYSIVIDNNDSCHRYIISLSRIGEGLLEVRSQPKDEKNKTFTERLLVLQGKKFTTKNIKELADIIKDSIKEDKCSIERNINLIEYYDKYRGEL